MRDVSTKTATGAGPEPRRDPTSGAIRRIDMRTLVGEAREIVISHRGQDYRLRVTSNGKLILTK